jgi:YHS domain-containing protein
MLIPGLFILLKLLRPSIPRKAQSLQSTALQRDPVCGTFVDPEAASTLKMRSEKGTVYFCSSDCQEKYSKEHQ